MKKLLGLCLGLTLLSSTALAQVTTVDGVGADKDSAVRDAMRNAVENVVGTYIDSSTLISQSRVLEDEIYAKAVGFVTDVKILNETRRDGEYRVKARIEVNTNPNSELVNRIAVIKSLGDPRIGVIIFKEGTSLEDGSMNKKYDDITEEAVNRKLLGMGFSHVLDANIVSKLRNSSLLNSVYNGDTNLLNEPGSYGVDVLVLARSNVNATKINLMQGEAPIDTQLVRGNAVITGKVLMLATGNIQGTFSAKGQGIDISEASASNKALMNASESVASEVEKILRKKAARVEDGIVINASVQDYDKLQELVNALKNIKNIQDVKVREYQNGKAIIDVDSNQKPHVIYRMLKENNDMNVFNEGITNNSIEISVS